MSSSSSSSSPTQWRRANVNPLSATTCVVAVVVMCVCVTITTTSNTLYLSAEVLLKDFVIAAKKLKLLLSLFIYIVRFIFTIILRIKDTTRLTSDIYAIIYAPCDVSHGCWDYRHIIMCIASVPGLILHHVCFVVFTCKSHVQCMWGKWHTCCCVLTTPPHVCVTWCGMCGTMHYYSTCKSHGFHMAVTCSSYVYYVNL